MEEDFDFSLLEEPPIEVAEDGTIDQEFAYGTPAAELDIDPDLQADYAEIAQRVDPIEDRADTQVDKTQQN